MKIHSSDKYHTVFTMKDETFTYDFYIRMHKAGCLQFDCSVFKIGSVHPTITINVNNEELVRSIEAITPFVDAMIILRCNAKSKGDYELADAIRSKLQAQGIKLYDMPAGITIWSKDNICKQSTQPTSIKLDTKLNIPKEPRSSTQT